MNQLHEAAIDLVERELARFQLPGLRILRSRPCGKSVGTLSVRCDSNGMRHLLRIRPAADGLVMTNLLPKELPDYDWQKYQINAETKHDYFSPWKNGHSTSVEYCDGGFCKAFLLNVGTWLNHCGYWPEGASVPADLRSRDRGDHFQA